MFNDQEKQGFQSPDPDKRFDLTVKGEVTKKSRQQVHDEHGQDGDVGNVLHTFLGSTGGNPSRDSVKTLIYINIKE